MTLAPEEFLGELLEKLVCLLVSLDPPEKTGLRTVPVP